VIAVDSEAGILVCCKSGAVWLRTVQAQGKKPTGGADFARGYRIKIGDAFG
jgi:methionyl-tRNA formyltransferase